MSIAFEYDTATQTSDIVLGVGGIQRDLGLTTRVRMALFTWGPGLPGDPPAPEGVGWWADTFSEDDYRFARSRLWLLISRKIDTALLQEGRDLALEALDQLAAEGLAEKFEVTASRLDTETVGLYVLAHRPKSPAPEHAEAWDFQFALGS